MSYTPTTWTTGDTITAEKLNKLEQGVADAGSLVVHCTMEVGETATITTDKTAGEIANALPQVFFMVDMSEGSISSGAALPISDWSIGGGLWVVNLSSAQGTTINLSANSADDPLVGTISM